jgi:hypothetical protein
MSEHRYFLKNSSLALLSFLNLMATITWDVASAKFKEAAANPYMFAKYHNG